jgi:large subunit ribosomal protein L29
MKARELREMSDEQLELSLREAQKTLFDLRFRKQTARLDAPSELRRYRKLIARILTVQRERQLARQQAQQPDARATTSTK